MAEKSKKNPFYFYNHVELRESTGLKAKNARELVNIIKDVPGSVIYYHMHVFLQQHQFLSPEPPNAFAYWTAKVLGEDALGELLGSIDVYQYNTVRALREKIIEVIEGYLFDAKDIRNAPPGKEFDFTKSRTFILPTPYTAHNLSDMVEALKKVAIGSIDFHVFNARLRLGRGTNDFSNWIDTSLGYPNLASRLECFDPYTYTLENLRFNIIDTIVNSPEWGIDNAKR
ncbi:MAG: DUF5752 family protein [Candidatus Omnitrophica bacterium]|jgi:hypothetical protein|nr:DUF5752 family protein [Candidatus Omnitrophota bacterium]